MTPAPVLHRMNHRIRRSKRAGKLVLAGVLLVSLVLGSVLVQGLLLALDGERQDLVFRAVLGLGLLVAVDLFAIVSTRRQHRMLDEAREDLQGMARGGVQS